MKTFLKTLLPGVAGSIAFWLLDTTLLRLGTQGRLWGMLAVLLVLSGASYALLRGQDGRRRIVASRRRIGGDATDRFDDVKIRQAEDVEFLSGNRVKGNSDVTVGRLDIE